MWKRHERTRFPEQAPRERALVGRVTSPAKEQGLRRPRCEEVIILPWVSSPVAQVERASHPLPVAAGAAPRPVWPGASGERAW
jgi:hypothetical protein